jgi:hypothetical protein
MRLLAGIVIAAAAWSQGSAGDHQDLLAKARTASLEYSRSLPDFLCTQIVHRSEDPMGANRWRPLDTLTVKVTWSGHEDYQLMTRNGRAVSGDLHSVGGPVSGGEFGRRLVDIFAPDSAAEFAWKGWGRVRKQRVAVFTYRVDPQHSRNRITFGATAVVAGFHGEISVDPESGTALRVTLTAEMPRGFPITACSSWTEYDLRQVGGRTFVLPVASETRMEQGRYLAVNTIEFRDYRKFHTDATITFK